MTDRLAPARLSWSFCLLFSACAGDATDDLDGGHQDSAGDDDSEDAGKPDGTDDPVDGGDVDGGELDGGEVDAGDNPAMCDVNGFGPVVVSDYLTTALGDFMLLSDADQGPLSKVQLELYRGGRAAFEHTIAGESFADCDVCLSLLEGCDAPQGDCAVHFFARSGQVTVTEYNDTLIEGTLTGVEAEEVTIDPDTFESTPVPGGRSYCVDGLVFSVPVSE